MAVLPVWRSPMISSRWPRPIGIMASMALMPVCSGSFTGWRSTTPGPGARSGELLGGDRALAVDRLAERVDHAADHRLADRHRHDAAGALDLVAFLDLGVLAEQHGADLSSSRFSAMPKTPCGNSSSSPAMTFEAVDAGDAVAAEMTEPTSATLIAAS
jgi:hypothetical protein